MDLAEQPVEDSQLAVAAEDQRRHQRPRAKRLTWIFGMALLAGVIVVALRASEAEELYVVARRARPWLLSVAILLQALTYFAQAEIFRGVGRAGDFRLTLRAGYVLSLIKLFGDQAVPSAGLSGTLLAATELAQRGMTRRLIASSVVVSIASYQLAYASSVVLALPVAFATAPLHVAVGVGCAVFVALSLSWSAIVLWLSGRTRPLPARISRVPGLRALLAFLRDADRQLSRSPQLLLRASACQLAIIGLDAATIWVLLHSLGSNAPALSVFASFMLASVLRSVGLVPGGLGTFEAAAVFALHRVEVPVSEALAATLLFRGLSFWAPMLMGSWLYQRSLRRALRAD